jgi:hypothetical protein
MLWYSCAIDQCNAWWRHKGNPNGRPLGMWPGSQLHGSYIFENPRWEDYEYEIRPEMNGNPLEWFGNGLTKAQLTGEHITDYLDTAYVPVKNPIEEAKKKKERHDLNGASVSEVNGTTSAMNAA